MDDGGEVAHVRHTMWPDVACDVSTKPVVARKPRALVNGGAVAGDEGTNG